MPHVYLLRCADGSLYAGSAKDLTARLRRHESGLASRYTRGRLPVALAWSCEVATWGDALREEHRIKRLRRAEKEALILAGNAAGQSRSTIRAAAPEPPVSTSRK